MADAETRYQSLVEQLPAVVYIDTHEENPITIYISRQVEKITGYPPEDWIFRPRALAPGDPSRRSGDHAAGLAAPCGQHRERRRSSIGSCTATGMSSG